MYVSLQLLFVLNMSVCLFRIYVELNYLPACSVRYLTAHCIYEGSLKKRNQDL